MGYHMKCFKVSLLASSKIRIFSHSWRIFPKAIGSVLAAVNKLVENPFVFSAKKKEHPSTLAKSATTFFIWTVPANTFRIVLVTIAVLLVSQKLLKDESFSVGKAKNVEIRMTLSKETEKISDGALRGRLSH